MDAPEAVAFAAWKRLVFETGKSGRLPPTRELTLENAAEVLGIQHKFTAADIRIANDTATWLRRRCCRAGLKGKTPSKEWGQARGYLVVSDQEGLLLRHPLYFVEWHGPNGANQHITGGVKGRFAHTVFVGVPSFECAEAILYAAGFEQAISTGWPPATQFQ